MIDAGYTGSICVKLYNHGKTDYKVHSGDKISQIVFIRVEPFDFTHAINCRSENAETQDLVAPANKKLAY